MGNTVAFIGTIGAIVVVTGLLWWWGYQSADCYNMAGFGSILYGRAPGPNGGRIATKWLVFMFIPLLPIRSFEIFNERMSADSGITNYSKTFQYRPLPHLYWKNLLTILLLIFAAFFWVMIIGGVGSAYFSTPAA